MSHIFQIWMNGVLWSITDMLITLHNITFVDSKIVHWEPVILFPAIILHTLRKHPGFFTSLLFKGVSHSAYNLYMKSRLWVWPDVNKYLHCWIIIKFNLISSKLVHMHAQNQGLGISKSLIEPSLTQVEIHRVVKFGISVASLGYPETLQVKY